VKQKSAYSIGSRSSEALVSFNVHQQKRTFLIFKKRQGDFLSLARSFSRMRYAGAENRKGAEESH
jgi:hypothetical protein